MHLFLQRPGLRIALVGVTLVVVQTTLCVQLRPFGVVVDLLLGFAVATALAASPEAGVFAGFVFGTLIDLLVTTPFGLSGLCYGLCAFAVGAVKATITVGQAWWLSMMLVAVGSAAGVAMFAGVGTLVGESGWLGSRLLLQIGVIAVVNALIAPVSVPTQRWAMAVGRDRG